MYDTLQLKTGVTVTVSAGPRILTRIGWDPMPPYSTEQTQEIDQFAMPWLLGFIAKNAGPESAPLRR